jgi:hypothetical protein
MSAIKKICYTLACTFFMLIPSIVHAQLISKNYYSDVGFIPMKVSQDGVNASPLALRYVFGKKLDKHLAVEGAYVMTVSRDESSVQGVNADTGISSYGLYLKSTLTHIKKIQVFARVGYAKTKLTSSVASYQLDHEVEGISYGFGMQNFFNQNWYIQSGYTVLPKKDGVSAKGFGLSVGYLF